MTTRRSPAYILPRAFPGIKAQEVEALIVQSQVHAYPPGTVLCHENALEDTFYIILEGEVEVTKIIHNTEGRLLKTLGAGDFFGEMALIHNAPRAATVTAKTQVVVLEIKKDAFDRVLQNSNSISLAMVREISNRLRANDAMAIEDLRLRAGELAQAYQKLAEQELARREFLSNVAHELRTPLMAASGYLQLLQKDMLPPDQMKAAMQTIGQNLQQIIHLVNDILFLQEMDLLLDEFRPVEMNVIAHHVLEKYQEKAAAHSVTLRLRDKPELAPIPGDATLLERALTALVDNAIKFSPNGGTVEIRLAEKENTLRISVQDEGIGIDPEIRPRIFDRFYHLERSGDKLFSGIGLGLAITRQVIEQHKGKLEVESTPGKGSTFTMCLPRA
jgi:signal transduction histidine kinase